MASVIKIKRSNTSSSVPSGGALQAGELAINTADKKLFSSSDGTDIITISGDQYNITSSGTTQVGTINLTVDNTALSNDSIDFVGGTGISVARESNGAISISSTGTVSQADTLSTARNFSIAGDVTASAQSFDGSGNVTLTTTLAADSVDGSNIADDSIDSEHYAAGSIDAEHIASGAVTNAKIASDAVTLGTQTTGNYVATASGSGGVSVSGSGSETAGITISLDDEISANTTGKAATAGNADTATALATARTIGGVSFDGTANINLPGVNATGNQDTSGNAATATALATARTIAVSGDVAGSASFDGTGNISISTTIQADSVALGTDTTGNYVGGISGTTGEISVSGSGSENATVTIGLPDDVTIAGQLNVSENIIVSGNTSVGGNMTIDGNLTVEGATTYISSQTVNVDDTMMKLSANNAADTVDHGVYAKYVDGATTKYAGYFRDASDSSIYKFYKGLEVEPTTTVNTGGTGYTLAQVDAVIDGGTY